MKTPAPTPVRRILARRDPIPRPVREPGFKAPTRLPAVGGRSGVEVERCIASHYGYDYKGNPRGAAHKTAPMGSHLRVIYGSRSVVVTVNDRGPYVAGRCVDLARSAFAVLAPPERGTIPVLVEHLP